MYGIVSSFTTYSVRWTIDVANELRVLLSQFHVRNTPKRRRDFFSQIQKTDQEIEFKKTESLAQDIHSAAVPCKFVRSWKSEWLTKCNSVCLANEMPIFSTLVLLDPFLLSVPEARISLIRDNAITRAKEKTSSWPSRKAVKAYYSKKRRWDERVREIFIVGVYRGDKRRLLGTQTEYRHTASINLTTKGQTTSLLSHALESKKW